MKGEMMSIRELITTHLRRFDEDEGGAILLACLAGCLIVLMVSLTMYDAGNITREKVKLQTATDSAAYSQAAVKARTMNANAYVNVTKRSIAGIYLTYFTAHNAFFSNMQAHLRNCSSGNSSCVVVYEPSSQCSAASLGATGNCIGINNKCCNIYIAVNEHFNDFAANGSLATNSASFGGEVEFESARKICTVTSNPSNPDDPLTCVEQAIDPTNPVLGVFVASHAGSSASSLEPARLYGAMDKYTKEIRQLSRYQEYMQVITPWWAFSEALARASHNGATMATTYPAPAGLQTSNLTGAYPSVPGPTGTMDDDWSWPASNLRNPSGNATLAAQFATFRGNICSEFTGGSDSSAPFRDPQLNEEMGIHVETLRRNSGGYVNDASKGYASMVFNGDDFTSNFKTVGGYTMCHLMQNGRYTSNFNQSMPSNWVKPGTDKNLNTMQLGLNMVPLVDPDYSSPYLLSVDPTSSALARMRMSNIVFGYYQGSDYRRDTDDSGVGMTRFEYMTQDYGNSLPVEAQGTGIWTLSRGEIVTLNNSDGNWHSSWTARIRPIARPGELNTVETEMSIPSNSFLSNAFRQAGPYLGVNADIAHIGGTADHHPEVWDSDTTTMDRAMKTMDSASSPGIFK